MEDGSTSLPAATAWSRKFDGCPICGGDRFRRLGTRGGPSHHSGLGVETEVVRCSRCHAVYPRPSLLPDRNPYEDHTASEYFKVHNPEEKATAGMVLAQKAEALLGRKGRMLELGCGRGENLQAARKNGWIVRGVEMTAHFAGQAQGIQIEVARAENASSLSESWDVILLAAILEHVYAPASLLRRVRQALEPGGLVFLDVPNECSLYATVGNLYMRLRGRNWVINLSPSFPPYHVVGFCPRSLRYLLRDVDLEIVELQTNRWLNELPRTGGLTRSVERMATDLVLSVGARLGMGAGISCWARRSS